MVDLTWIDSEISEIYGNKMFNHEETSKFHNLLTFNLQIHEVVFPVIPETQKRRGFAFVEFTSEDSVENACQSNFQTLGHTKVTLE